MSFPLLHLPAVALRTVLKLIELPDGMNFILCSKKSQNLIQFEYRLKKLRLTFHHNRRSVVRISDEETTLQYNFEYRSQPPPVSDDFPAKILAKMREMPEIVDHRKIGDTTYAICQTYPNILNNYRTYWEDPAAGALIFVKLIADLFGIIVDELVVTSESKNVVEWVITHQDSIRELSYHGNTRIFEAMWPREFRRRCIEGYNTDFTNEDLNEMLLRGDSNSMYIKVRGVIDFETVTRGLNATMVIREEPKTYIVGPDWSNTIKTSWDYRKQDGTMVSVFEFIAYEGKHTLVMLTWPDSEGNMYDS
uniref:F-box domain-containing protein n=1 Tax=Caenorhabditis tropicalis TaxID=1561998 RepID=A0A1I7U4F3_9PELO